VRRRLDRAGEGHGSRFYLLVSAAALAFGLLGCSKSKGADAVDTGIVSDAGAGGATGSGGSGGGGGLAAPGSGGAGSGGVTGVGAGGATGGAGGLTGGSGGTAAPGQATCQEGRACAVRCADGDGACVGACAASVRAAERAAFDTLVACTLDACGSWSLACACMEQCFGGGSCLAATDGCTQGGDDLLCNGMACH